MATAQELVAKAASQIGVKENPSGSNRVKYWDYYKEKTGVNLQSNPWCAAFVTWCMGQVGGWKVTKDEGRFRYCPSLVNWAKNNGQWLDREAKPKPGDIIIFSNKSRACHVGIVESRPNSYEVITIEGNTSTTSNDNGGAVMRRTRTYGKVGSSWYILGFIRTPWSGESSNSQPPSFKDVDSSIVDEVIAGKWGSGGERKNRLMRAGYNYNSVQNAVNIKLLGKGSADNVASTPVGTYQITASALNVRTGPDKSSKKKSKNELTQDGRKHSNSNGALLRGTRVTVSEVRKSGDYIWGKIPSGWICLKEGSSSYAKQV